MLKPKRAPWALAYRSSDTFIITVVCVGMFADMLAYGIIVPVIPRALVERADVPPIDVQKWISILLSTYGVTLFIGSPLVGYFTDAYTNRKVPFVLGLAAMAGATLLFLFGKSVYMLLLARMLQGLAGAAVGVVGFALLADTVDKSGLRQAMGYVSLALNWGMLLGPSIGGLVYETAGYYAVFAVPAGILLVDIALRLLMIEKAGQADAHESTYPRDYGTIQTSETEEHESNDLQVENTNTESDDLSRRKFEDTPLLKRSSTREQRQNRIKGSNILLLLKEPRVLSNLYGVVFTASLFSAFSTTLPLFVMHTFHWTTAGAGVLFVFLTVPSLFGSLVGRLMDKKGGRVLATAACIGCAVCLILLRLVHDNSSGNVVVLVVLLLLIGTGTLILRVANMAEIGLTVHGMQAQDPDAFAGASLMGQAYALLNMAYASGEFIGPILSGFMSVKMGWNGMTLMWGVISFLTAVPVGLFMGGWVLKPRDKGKRIEADE